MPVYERRGSFANVNPRRLNSMLAFVPALLAQPSRKPHCPAISRNAAGTLKRIAAYCQSSALELHQRAKPTGHSQTAENSPRSCQGPEAATCRAEFISSLSPIIFDLRLVSSRSSTESWQFSGILPATPQKRKFFTTTAAGHSGPIYGKI